VLKNENLTPNLKDVFGNFAFKNQSVISYNSKQKGNPIMYKKKLAFTLAEVLITLGVIGVVAALTIPNLITAYKAKQLRTQFLKSYSNLAQTFRRMQADDLDTDLRSSEYTASNPFYKTFMTYQTGAKLCAPSTATALKTPEGCYSYIIGTDDNSYKTLSRTAKIPDGMFNNGEVLLANGSLVFFDDSPKNEGWIGVTIYIDINGYINGPNLLGYDFFVFEVIDGTLKPMGATGTSCYRDSSTSWQSWHCYSDMDNTIKAINDPDYFKQTVKKYR
jgi:type II secretory pathway pseudopilin PulG